MQQHSAKRDSPANVLYPQFWGDTQFWGLVEAVAYDPI
jgi:hypothetical protein